MLKWSPYLCLLSLLPLSSCTQLSQVADGIAPDSDDIVLMPSMGKGASRANKTSPETKELENSGEVNRITDPNEKAEMPAATEEEMRELDALEGNKKKNSKKKSSREPSAAQQEAALKTLAEPSISMPRGPSSPSLIIEDEEDVAPAAPLPNSIELRGLRSPSLPNQLPMEVKS